VDYESRISRVREEIAEQALDAFLVTNLTNVAYLTGFTGTNGQVLVDAQRAIFFSDPRYEARASDLVVGADVVIYPTRLTDLLPQHLIGISRLGVEAQTMTLAERDLISNAIEGAEMVATKNVVEDLRRTKEAGELALLKQAAAVADEAFAWVLERLVPGASERETALALEIKMRGDGAQAVSFEPIVGSGPLSAHIHHTAGERLFEKGDLVLLDFGAKVDGYCSDLTRTVVIGPGSEEQRALYEEVLQAQHRGLEVIAPDVACLDVDAAARRVIEGAGHGDTFGHGLGHGVGLDIHEAPRLHKTSEEKLRVDDIVTVEPGVYLRDFGGVRIEDLVHVSAGGVEILSGAPKDHLIEV
jgi:Xaa-Pro aminopeptidase